MTKTDNTLRKLLITTSALRTNMTSFIQLRATRKNGYKASRMKEA